MISFLCNINSYYNKYNYINRIIVSHKMNMKTTCKRRFKMIKF